MTVKLHRCRVMFAKAGGHPCWRVQQALDEAGVDYEVVKHPALRWNRDDYEKLTGQKLLPAIEFEDGTILREESKDLIARIKDGRLPAGAAQPITGPPPGRT
jgi:Glutathione S-transferase, N-terminal domain